MSPEEDQDQNTAKLVMNAFYKVQNKDGITASEITRYLRKKFGDVWKTSTLTSKAEATLRKSAELGFLDRDGDKYMTHLARGMCCRRRRRRRRSRRRCGSRRRPSRRRRCRPRRRRRRRRSCGCK